MMSTAPPHFHPPQQSHQQPAFETTGSNQRMIVESNGSLMPSRDFRKIRRFDEINDDHESNDQQQEDNNAEKIPRPMNSFMIFAKYYRKVIQMSYPSVDNKVVSRMLGEKWASLTADQRDYYSKEADKLAALHKEAYPNWKFKRAPPGKRPKRDIRTVHKYASAPSAKPATTSATIPARTSQGTTRSIHRPNYSVMPHHMPGIIRDGNTPLSAPQNSTLAHPRDLSSSVPEGHSDQSIQQEQLRKNQELLEQRKEQLHEQQRQLIAQMQTPTQHAAHRIPNNVASYSAISQLQAAAMQRSIVRLSQEEICR